MVQPHAGQGLGGDKGHQDQRVPQKLLVHQRVDRKGQCHEADQKGIDHPIDIGKIDRHLEVEVPLCRLYRDPGDDQHPAEQCQHEQERHQLGQRDRVAAHGQGIGDLIELEGALPPDQLSAVEGDQDQEKEGEGA